MAEDDACRVNSSVPSDRKRKLDDSGAELKESEDVLTVNSDLNDHGKLDEVNAADNAAETTSSAEDTQDEKRCRLDAEQGKQEFSHLFQREILGRGEQSSLQSEMGVEDDLKNIHQRNNGVELPKESEQLKDGKDASPVDTYVTGNGKYTTESDIQEASDDQNLHVEHLQAKDGQHPSEADAPRAMETQSYYAEYVHEAGKSKQLDVEVSQDTDIKQLPEEDINHVSHVEGTEPEGKEKQLPTGAQQMQDVKQPLQNVPLEGGEKKATEEHTLIPEDSKDHVMKETGEENVLRHDSQIKQSSTEVAEAAPLSPLEPSETDDSQPTSRKMEVPNTKVGVLIGKAGDTIRFLQYNSGAKIQITRDSDSNPYSSTRTVELFGSLDSCIKAEQLIKDVIAEAEAGGSPALVARGFGTAQSGSELMQMQVPNEKVGLIIGKGGETIKNLQTRSGARIQLIPHFDGDQPKERTVKITGSKKQIDIAREMIKEVMCQPSQRPSMSGGYVQQAIRPRGSSGLPQWGAPRGMMPRGQSNYEYRHHSRNAYSSNSASYSSQNYGGYYQQPGPRGGFTSGWDQRPSGMQGPLPHGSGYDYYNQSGPPPTAAVPVSGQGPSQSSYYGQQQASDYGQPSAYSLPVPSQQGYDGQTPTQHSYGSAHPSYAQQGASPYPQSYGRPPYTLPSSQGAGQTYGAPRMETAQYQGHPAPTNPYGSTPVQQAFPYSTPAQQQYGYGTAVGAGDGYSQPATAPAAGYAHPSGAAPYSQPSGTSQTMYAQGAQTVTYSQYPSAQQGYTEQQQSQATPGYGSYQSTSDAGYAAGQAQACGQTATTQAGYAQASSNVAGYDQTASQSGYVGHAGSAAPVSYTKSLSPQPVYAQYDANQVYGQGQH